MQTKLVQHFYTRIIMFPSISPNYNVIPFPHFQTNK